MRYAFRLAELLGHTPDRRKRPGTIKAIVEYTGLDRHQVAALLKNEAKYIPIEALSRLCDYLIEHGYARPEELPGALFAVTPENFWEMIARRNRLELCVGVRKPIDDDSPDTAWIVASDSVLAGEVLNGVSTLGGTVKASSKRASGGELPHIEHLRQTLVWSPGTMAADQVQARSQAVYDEFSDMNGDKAMICLGSVKSNPTVELVFANAFGCDPFVSEDHVEKASDRACPFFLRYRDRDPHPPSCCAGVKLSKKDKSDQPGLYYETANGKWEFAGGATADRDAALVFYIFRESLGRLEMVLSGFSGRATRLLARTLAHRAEDFWPPTFHENYLQVGAYLVQYDSDDTVSNGLDVLATDQMANATIIPMPTEAIAKRLGKGQQAAQSS
jgi:hypothetical protein